MKIVASVLTFIGSLVALTASGACWIVVFEEPNTPSSLIK